MEGIASPASKFQLHARSRLLAFQLDIDLVSELLQKGAKVLGPKGNHTFQWETRPDRAEKALRELGFLEVEGLPGREPGNVATFRKGDWGAWLDRRAITIGPIKDN